MSDVDALLARLQKIEALFAGATTEGERLAADAARDRVQARLDEAAAAGPLIEIQYSLPDDWSRMLFMALARRHGIEPYRYRRQRRTTVVCRVSQRFSDQTLWPEYCRLSRVLTTHLDRITRGVISSTIHADTSDAKERDLPLGLPGGA